MAKQFSVRICVDSTRLQRYKLMSLPPCFTQNPAKTFIEVRDISDCKRDVGDGFVIEPTALRVVREANHHTVPYSDHCDCEELHVFVQSIKPSCVRLIVPQRGARIPTELSALVNKELPMSSNCVPDSVRLFMACSMNAAGHLSKAPRTIEAAAARRKPVISKRPSESKGVQFESPEKCSPVDQSTAKQEAKLDLTVENNTVEGDDNDDVEVVSYVTSANKRRCGKQVPVTSITNGDVQQPDVATVQQTVRASPHPLAIQAIPTSSVSKGQGQSMTETSTMTCLSAYTSNVSTTATVLNSTATASEATSRILSQLQQINTPATASTATTHMLSQLQQTPATVSTATTHIQSQPQHKDTPSTAISSPSLSSNTAPAPVAKPQDTVITTRAGACSVTKETVATTSQSATTNRTSDTVVSAMSSLIAALNRHLAAAKSNAFVQLKDGRLSMEAQEPQTPAQTNSSPTTTSVTPNSSPAINSLSRNSASAPFERLLNIT